ncbi:hypothetical protein BRC83_06675 [Halobacteriales archaeon QS_1_68_17]|nr:MAG: hypothetical protein BRC83_06675 [Halobacteriales archaeon QS_1_68_17]
MALSDIADGVETTAEQRDRGVATVDDTADDLVDRLRPFADALPCTPAGAATVVEAYAAGESVGACAAAAGVAPATAARALHLLGERVTPLGPTGREVVRDWLAGELPRTEAVALTGGDEADFALAAYVETHDPIPAAREAVEDALAPPGDAAVDKRDALAGTMSDVPDLR